MTALITTFTLASEAVGEKTWWNPYLKGALIAVLAIGLFVGAGYLLLYTNVGSRLGFLLTAAAFAGFMAVLSVFWITGQFPNGPFGSAPGWPIEEVLTDLSQSDFDAVRALEEGTDEAASEIVGQFRSDFDADLDEGVRHVEGSPADYLTVQVLSDGGGRKWPIWWSEHPTYSAMELCRVAEVQVLPLDAPPTPECDTEQGTVWIVSVKDLGSLRLPAWFFFAGSSLLFALSLLALNRYELEVEGGTGGPSSEAEPADDDAPSGNGSGSGDPEPATA